MTEREYRESPGISRSELWLLNPHAGGTPEKFLWARNNLTEPTPAMTFGTLCHTALLEPHKIEEQFVLAPDVDRRTKDGKAAYAEFLASVGDRTVVSADDLAMAMTMAKGVLLTTFAGKLLDGEHERVFRWQDLPTGEECKIRVDSIRLVGDRPVIVDYKTCTDASTDGFLRKALSLGYDFQAGMYSEGIERCMGVRPRFVFIAQEKTAPYSVNILEADEGFVQRGRDLFRELIGIYHSCRMSGEWWGYMGAEAQISRLSLPAWAQ